MATLSRPTRAYLSLDDTHTQHFFTKTRVQKHLQRAGLLNSNKEILTQIEYDNKQKEVAIGRDNRRKIDEAIAEVLNDMAKEHWAYARDYVENMKKDLIHQLRRIETQYRQRTQPIIIRHTHDGRIQLDSRKQTNTRNRTTKSLTSVPSEVRPGDLLTSRRSSRASDTEHSIEFADIREKLDDLQNKLAALDRRFNNYDKRLNVTSPLASFVVIEKRLTQLEKRLQNISNHRYDRQSITASTSQSMKNSKPTDDLISDELKSTERQAIMPYIEVLPTFDMFSENEWI